MKNYQNDHPQIPKPKLNGYGTSFGVYGGDELTDYEPAGTIDTPNLNRLTLQGATEFTEFETYIKDYVLGMLGFPIVRVELTEFQIKQCVQEAVSKLNYHAPLWSLQYASFDASAGQNIYEIPLYMLHNLENVIYRKTLLTIAAQAGTLEFDFFIKYFQDNFLFSNFQVSDFYLMQQHLEMIRKILSQEGSWDLVNGNILQLYPTPVNNNQKVILIYRGLDTFTMHPYYKNWIQRYALAVAKGILGEIRGKYRSLPSPGGGASLNGADLIQQSTQEKEKLKEELLSEIEEPAAFTLF